MCKLLIILSTKKRMQIPPILFDCYISQKKTTDKGLINNLFAAYTAQREPTSYWLGLHKEGVFFSAEQCFRWTAGKCCYRDFLDKNIKIKRWFKDVWNIVNDRTNFEASFLFKKEFSVGKLFMYRPFLLVQSGEGKDLKKSKVACY